MAQRLITPPPMGGLFGLRNAWTEQRAQSIERVPAHLLSEARRIYLSTRARNGDDVRAWCDWAAPNYIGRWWLWDGAAWNFITCRFGVKEFLGYAK